MSFPNLVELWINIYELYRFGRISRDKQTWEQAAHQREYIPSGCPFFTKFMIKYVIVRVIVTVFGVILFNKSIKKKRGKPMHPIADL